MVLPVTWLAAGTTKTRVLLAIAAALGSTVLPPGILGYSPPTSELVRVVIFPGIMAALAITAHLVTRTVTRHRALLEVKDRELERLYQQSGERQRLLDGVVETVSVGVWALDGDGADILINERARTARTQASQARERGHAALTEETVDDPETKSPMDRAVQGEEFSEELFWVGSGEARRAYSATARGLRDEEGRPAGAVVALTDVTALIQDMTVKDKFVATISHELRTPLTSFMGYLEMMIDDPDPVQVPGQLAVIERNAHRLLTLVNDLLLVASDGRDLDMRITRFSSILERAAADMESEASAKGQPIRIDVDGPLPARLDPEQMTQVIRSLLSNAIKFSPDGSEISLTAQSTGAALECSVKDQGIGMDENEQAQAFTKFFRADHAMNTAIPGAGLGLAISKAIVERHGGSISLTSRPRAGTTVTFRLPHSPNGG